MSRMYPDSEWYAASRRHFERKAQAEGTLSHELGRLVFDPDDEVGNVLALTPFVPAVAAMRARRGGRLLLAARRFARKHGMANSAEMAEAVYRGAGKARNVAGRAWTAVRNADYKKLGGKVVGFAPEALSKVALGVVSPKKHWGMFLLDAAAGLAAAYTYWDDWFGSRKEEVDSEAVKAARADAQTSFVNRVNSLMSVTNDVHRLGRLHDAGETVTPLGGRETGPVEYQKLMNELVKAFRDLNGATTRGSPEEMQNLARMFGELKAAVDSASPDEAAASTEFLRNRGAIVTEGDLLTAFEKDTEGERQKAISREQQKRREEER